MYRKAYTLIELSVVLFIIGILYTTAVPMYQQTVVRAREAALKENLYVMRKLLDQYYKDRHIWPSKLDELVQHGYLRSIPTDPITRKNDSWITKCSEDGMEDIYDVFSGSSESGTNGQPYSSW
ncbi:MAG: type II secretion system protein [Candidatus Riflebacteria bacterium]|nr:type II secretion system protein [Candidatus Riflebacteria bacterium]